MTTPSTLNPFFNKFSYVPEQELLQDLIVESIQIYGHEVYYIPRNIGNFDQIYLTDDQSTYSTVIPVPIYLETVDGFAGQGDIFTKFGLEIRDQIMVSMANRTFQRVIQPITGKPRPDEGDLIYFTLNRKVFQIRFVNNKEIFYPLGVLPLHKLTCELFEYSDETFATGIPEIDNIQSKFSLNILDNVYTTEDGTPLVSDGDYLTISTYDDHNIDPMSDNDTLHLEADGFLDWSQSNPFGQIVQ